MGSKYGYKAAKKRPKTPKDIIRDGFLMTRGLYRGGYPWNLPTDTTIDKVAQALLDHLLALPELQEEMLNPPIEAGHEESKKLRNLVRRDIKAALQRELGMEENDPTN